MTTSAKPIPEDTPRSARLGTKIVATLGPALLDANKLPALIEAGVDVVRLNFSHGTRADHARMLTEVRAEADRQQRTVAVMGDLCGPKIRLGQVEPGGVSLTPGATLRIVAEEVLGIADRVSINQPEILRDLAPGERVLIDDGQICLRIERAEPDELLCRCEVGGTLHDRKGVNVPDSDIALASLTDKDLSDADWAMEEAVDFLALSFVRTRGDIDSLRDRVRARGRNTQIVAKIETPQAVANLTAIVAAADAVLVARGDLGVELDVARVPRVQKDIIDGCRLAGKPVIVATQMLQSMIEAPTPTRAEVSDIANAVVDGADALMLSGETAVGRYPTEAVKLLRRVALETESYDQTRAAPIGVNTATPGVTAAVARSMHLIAEELGAKALAVWTEAGTTARLLSKHRSDRPVLAVTPSGETERRVALYFGVRAARVAPDTPAEARLDVAVAALRERGWASRGDPVVLGFSPRTLEQGATGSIVIHFLDGDESL